MLDDPRRFGNSVAKLFQRDGARGRLAETGRGLPGRRSGARRAAALLAALALCAAVTGCATARPPPLEPGAAPREVLDHFLRSLEAGRFDEAHPLLGERWRARSTPRRLAADLAAAGPVGRDALERLRALLDAGVPVEVQGGEASLPAGEGRRARLLREPGGWRVDALE